MSIHHLQPGESLKEAIDAHDTVLLASGRHVGGFRIRKSVKLIGEVGAIIEGDGSNPCIWVTEDGIDVSLKGLGFEKGIADFGGGILIDAYTNVYIESCRFNENRAGHGGGAGIGVLLGNVRVKDSRFEKKQDAFVSNLGEMSLSNCALLGGLSVYEGAQLHAAGGIIKGGVTLRGSSSRQPHAVFDGTEIDQIQNHSVFPGNVTQR